MAKRPPRRTGARETPRDTREARIRAVVEKIHAIAADHVASGGTDEEWSEALGAVVDCRTTAPDPSGFDLPTFEILGFILERWHTDSRWLDASGNPRPVRPSGPHGFAALCREVGVGRGSRVIAARGLDVGILRTDARGALLPTDRTAVVRGPRAAVMKLAGIGIAAWLSTVRHDLSPDVPESLKRLERGIYNQAIPAELEGEFHRFTRRLGNQWIYQIDNWVIAHRAPPGNHPVAHVGVHACAFSHPSPPERPALRRSRRG